MNLYSFTIISAILDSLLSFYDVGKACEILGQSICDNTDIKRTLNINYNFSV